MSRPVVVLIGPPGAGKTTAARALAALLGVEARDTDADVETAAGRSVADIFVESGEAAFRRLERDAVAAALSGHAGVVSVGGGAPLDAPTRELLARHTVAFLDVALAAAARRVGFDAPRPLLLDSPRATWTRLMDVRRPVYAQLAAVIVDTTELTPEQVAAAIVAGLGLTISPTSAPV